MKTVMLARMLVLGVALTFVAAGCKTQKYKTPLDRHSKQQPSPVVVSTAPPFNPTETVVNKELPDWPETDYTADTEAFAAQTVHFDFDSAVVRQNEFGNVTLVAEKLRADGPAKLIIQGHCDERGTEEYNRSLGERRALALREALEKAGIDPMRVRTKSFGEDQPVDRAQNEMAWARNRRGVFVLLHPKQ